MKRALITGSTGVVGRHLVLQLLSSGEWDIGCIVRKGSRYRLSNFLLANGYNIAQVSIYDIDLTDFAQVANLFTNNQFDVVFNCAAKVSVGGKKSEDIVSINTDITHFLVEAMLNHKRGVLVHTSSIAALGHTNSGGVIDESCGIDILNKQSPYARSKFVSENEVWRGAKMGLDVVVVNPSVILGEGGQMEKVIGFMRRKMPFYTSGAQGFVDVRDVVRAMEMLATDSSCYGQKYCLNGWNLSYRELIEAFSKRKTWFFIPKILLRLFVGSGMASTLSSHRLYDGVKVVSALNGKFSYTDFEQCVEHIEKQLK